MKFTALEEYGLRCILCLAQKEVQVAEQLPCGTANSFPEQPEPALAALTLGEIARHEGLTEQYAGKIFRILQKAKLVESVRGRKGGYRLTRPAHKITVGDTLTALGGRLFDGEVCGRYTGDRHVCVRSTDCAIRSLWRELQGMMDRVLERTTIRDLVVTEHVMSLRLQSEVADASQPVTRPRELVSVGRIIKAEEIPSKERK